MNIWDIVILCLVGAAVFAGIVRIRRKGISCGGSCSECAGCAGCAGRRENGQEESGGPKAQGTEIPERKRDGSRPVSA